MPGVKLQQEGRVPTDRKDVSVSLQDLLQLPQRLRHRKTQCRTQSLLILLLLPQWVRHQSFLMLCQWTITARLGLGNKAECRFNSRLFPLVLLPVLIQTRQPMMAARLQEGNKAECRGLCKKAECQLISACSATEPCTA